MLSFEVFVSEFIDILCARFGLNLTERLIEVYYNSFKHFSDSTFTELCRLAFCECKFMPEPQWFSDRAEDLAERARIEADQRVALPSAQQRELDNMTEEQRIENVRRLRAMTRNTFRVIKGGKRA